MEESGRRRNRLLSTRINLGSPESSPSPLLTGNQEVYELDDSRRVRHRPGGSMIGNMNVILSNIITPRVFPPTFLPTQRIARRQTEFLEYIPTANGLLLAPRPILQSTQIVEIQPPSRKHKIDGSDMFPSPSNTEEALSQILKTRHQDNLDYHPWERKQRKRKISRDDSSSSQATTVLDYSIANSSKKNKVDAPNSLQGPSADIRINSEHTGSPNTETTTTSANVISSLKPLTHTTDIGQRQQKRLLFSAVLYESKDENVLTEYQCEIRKHLEIFEAGVDDVRVSTSPGRCGRIVLGQVGIRCLYCATSSGPLAAHTKGAVNFSRTIEGVYQLAQNMAKAHLCEGCCRIPSEVKKRLAVLRGDRRRAKGGKRYWANSIRRLGIYLSEDKTMRVMRRNRQEY